MCIRDRVSGVYKPDSGNVEFDGREISGKFCYQINESGISRTYQVINLFKKMTVMENVLVGMHSRLKGGFWPSLLRLDIQKKEEKAAREKAVELLRFVGLEDRAFEQAGSLSYGDQRLLEIVRGDVYKRQIRRRLFSPKVPRSPSTCCPM